MKNKTKNIIKTRNGAASIFVTIFTIILLGIIVLSFSRIIIAEVTRSSNNDLSQSAYDSALAGIEDAKIALLKYHDCLSKGYTAGSATSDVNSCEYIIYHMNEGIAKQDCDTVAKSLNRVIDERSDAHGVIVQATQKSSDAGNSSNMLQAYTCVTIQENLSDYRSTLSNQQRIRIIPLRSAAGGTGIDSIEKIHFNWFSLENLNAANKTNAIYNESTDLPPNNSGNSMAPPIMSVQLLQANQTFSLSELNTAKGINNTNHSTLFLKPRSGSADTTNIPASEVAFSADKSTNNLYQIECKGGGSFYCSAEIAIPKAFRDGKKNEGASFLVVTLPYGAPDTDFSVQLFTNRGLVGFTGVQARIDSTGRANDLYRRIESRVELVDTNFPYPEFAIHMNSDIQSRPIEKLFWVTQDCWIANEGDLVKCNNNDFSPDLSKLE